MKFPESWLRSFCDPPLSTEALADRLTMIGLEVEEVGSAAPPFSSVVVGRVLSVERHPAADKLSVCVVDDGSGTRTIVCGAPNVAPGLRVPCALPGAVLPGGLAISPVTMRGVRSEGMLCSARELGLSDDHGGLLVLPDDAPVGADLRAALALDDAVFTLKLTPNLAHCFGVFGIAREVSAATGTALRQPTFAPVTLAHDDRLPVRILAPDLCGRFSGRVIRGVNARAATPDWMKRRLERAGQRPISALVDISNYVMLELGRPSHVFDLARIHGGLEVRWGRAGETLELLNGQTIELDARVGVIADERQVESLAGIMGGNPTAVSLDTTDIYLEAAFWWPVAIAGRARRYNFSTDAAQRFERGVDAATTVEHIEYLSQLILEICGGRAGPVDDQIIELPARPPVSMRTDRARRIIGVPIPDEEMAACLDRLGLAVAREPGRLVVNPPSWRFDLRIEEDLIEEVVRIWGFEKLPVRPPRAPTAMLAQPEAQRPVAQLRRAMAARDFQEVITFGFTAGALEAKLGSDVPIQLLNPIAAHLDVMRTTLWSGLVDVLRGNLARKASRVRLFEIGRVFTADPSIPSGPHSVRGVRQPLRMAALAFGGAVEDQWGEVARPVDFFDLKGDLEALAGARAAHLRYERTDHPALHPGRSARIVDGDVAVGWLGVMHPAVQQALELSQAPVLFDLDLAWLGERELPRPEEASRFPPVIRDLAWLLDPSIPAQSIIAEIHSALAQHPHGALVRNLRLFDEYRGKGLENKDKSLAFRFWLQDNQRTLNDGEVAGLLDAVVRHLADRLGARLRAAS
jgi:phenylalanyl-tRNA synthetase beta chain